MNKACSRFRPKGTHESVAVYLITTKLKGNIRNLLGNETTIAEITNKLSTSVKSVEVLSTKIMNIKQGGKPANTYCSEDENLTKSLENVFISDGLSSEIASKYSLQVAVKANQSVNCLKVHLSLGYL